MKRILVTAAGSPAGRSFVSALGLSEDPTFVVGIDSSAPAPAGRGANVVCPAEDSGAIDSFRDLVLTIVRTQRISLIHPQSDEDVAVLDESRESWPGLLALPDRADVVASQNRLHARRLMQAAGIPAPAAIRIHDRLDLDAAVREIGGRSGRVLVRPVQARSNVASKIGTSGSQVGEWIRHRIETRGMVAQDFVMTAWLPGRDFVFQGLWNEGSLVTSAVVERLEVPNVRSAQPGGAVAANTIHRTVHRTIHRTIHSTGVNRMACDAALAVCPRPHGPVAVTMREDARGTLRVTGLTVGRFRPELHFMAAAGSPLAEQYVRLGFGCPAEAAPLFDAVEEDMYWVCRAGLKPHLFKGAPSSLRRAA